jgi:methylated-DNA-[protein]-cysteine S-methyltransferase
MSGFTFFDSPVGRCGIAWNDRGIVGVQLPEARATQEQEPPPEVQRAIDRIVSMLAGTDDDLSSIVLDFDGVPAFDRRVYEATRTIPRGATRTYGEVAKVAGAPGEARAVGQALGRNPFPIIVPCHRVMGAGGRVVGFSAPGGVDTKLRMLALEGAILALQ